MPQVVDVDQHVCLQEFDLSLLTLPLLVILGCSLSVLSCLTIYPLIYLLKKSKILECGRRRSARVLARI